MRLCNLTALVLAATLGLSLTAISAAKADTVDEIVKRGEMRVAIQTQGPPISFVDKNGERTGLAVEIVKMMAKDMEVKLTLLDYDWKGLIPALQSEKADFIAADMTPTPKRALQLNFTRPIFYGDVVTFTMSDKPFQKWQDLNDPSVTLGVVQASSHVGMAKEFLPKAKIKEFAGGGPALAQALASGRVDAAINELGTAKQFIKEFQGMRILEGAVVRGPLSFAVRPADTHMLHFLDNYIELLKADRRLDQLLEYWWLSDAWEADHK